MSPRRPPIPVTSGPRGRAGAPPVGRAVARPSVTESPSNEYRPVGHPRRPRRQCDRRRSPPAPSSPAVHPSSPSQSVAASGRAPRRAHLIMLIRSGARAREACSVAGNEPRGRCATHPHPPRPPHALLVLASRDCSAGPVFPIAGFGIEDLVTPAELRAFAENMGLTAIMWKL